MRTDQLADKSKARPYDAHGRGLSKSRRVALNRCLPPRVVAENYRRDS